jgi:hypothetical protein
VQLHERLALVKLDYPGAVDRRRTLTRCGRWLKRDSVSKQESGSEVAHAALDGRRGENVVETGWSEAAGKLTASVRHQPLARTMRPSLG